MITHADANTDSHSYPDCHTYTYRAGDCSNKSCRSDVPTGLPLRSSGAWHTLVPAGG
jgi:hypothetical protein